MKNVTKKTIQAEENIASRGPEMTANRRMYMKGYKVETLYAEKY